MADLSVAAQRPLNWNLLPVSAASAPAPPQSSKPATWLHAAPGGKVVALTIPHSFGIRLSFASGFVLDAMPRLGGADARCRATEKLALFHDKAARAPQ